jgi:hypothetical protein
MAPRGFAIERRRGDGYSNKTARECLRKQWKDCPYRPEDTARIGRQQSFDQWEKTYENVVKAEEKYGLLLTREALFTPYKNEDGDDFFCGLHKDEEGTEVHLYGGYWYLYLDHRKGRWWDWTLMVKVGDSDRKCNFITGPQFVRRKVVESLSEDVYTEFKAMLLEEPELGGLKEVLNKGVTKLEELGGKDAVAYSFVTSPSSERLFKRLGIRVEAEHAFLFPHYVWE